jgi:hypothetical protein
MRMEETHDDGREVRYPRYFYNECLASVPVICYFCRGFYTFGIFIPSLGKFATM